jgi:hypothetical protein
MEKLATRSTKRQKYLPQRGGQRWIQGKREKLGFESNTFTPFTCPLLYSLWALASLREISLFSAL